MNGKIIAFLLLLLAISSQLCSSIQLQSDVDPTLEQQQQQQIEEDFDECADFENRWELYSELKYEIVLLDRLMQTSRDNGQDNCKRIMREIRSATTSDSGYQNMLAALAAVSYLTSAGMSGACLAHLVPLGMVHPIIMGSGLLGGFALAAGVLVSGQHLQSPFIQRLLSLCVEYDEALFKALHSVTASFEEADPFPGIELFNTRDVSYPQGGFDQLSQDHQQLFLEKWTQETCQYILQVSDLESILLRLMQADQQFFTDIHEWVQTHVDVDVQMRDDTDMMQTISDLAYRSSLALSAAASGSIPVAGVIHLGAHIPAIISSAAGVGIYQAINEIIHSGAEGYTDRLQATEMEGHRKRIHDGQR